MFGPAGTPATSRARAQLCSLPFSGDEKLLHLVVDLQTNLKSRIRFWMKKKKKAKNYFVMRVNIFRHEICTRKALHSEAPEVIWNIGFYGAEGMDGLLCV